MATTLTWLGHGSWLLHTGGQSLLIDPFLDDNPSSPVKSDQVAADYILISHGHADHVSDAAKIARRTGATVISNFEICQWLAQQGVEKTIGHNLGGGSDHPWGRVKLTLAHHSSSLPDGANGGNPAGFLLTLKEGPKTLYFACDTALFYDMKLIGAAGIDLAVLPIGDLFTMGPDDSIEAIRLLQPKQVIPAHYDTWPPIAQDASAWEVRVKAETQAVPVVMKPGQKLAI
ncbi:MAG TPA: metal-dependent hydrolase [Pirellulales bacterium]|jgi:L-ascorbate metabolism protein UlaG (beta-lactamase superfamily)|nr:metal-dependent hydrolase [Pirellulales bacterium]